MWEAMADVLVVFCWVLALAVFIGAGIYLLMNGHGGWAAFLFIASLFVSAKRKTNKKTEAGE